MDESAPNGGDYDAGSSEGYGVECEANIGAWDISEPKKEVKHGVLAHGRIGAPAPRKPSANVELN